MVYGPVLLKVHELVAEIPALAHLPGRINTALRTNLSWPVIQRYAKAMARYFTFIITHWQCRLLPVDIPRLLLFLQFCLKNILN